MICQAAFTPQPEVHSATLPRFRAPICCPATCDSADPGGSRCHCPISQRYRTPWVLRQWALGCDSKLSCTQFKLSLSAGTTSAIVLGALQRVGPLGSSGPHEPQATGWQTHLRCWDLGPDESLSISAPAGPVFVAHETWLSRLRRFALPWASGTSIG